MKVRAFITHKEAENFSDCQDRFGVNSGTKSIAVSDGMSMSWQQKIWAQILVDKFTEQPDWLPNKDTINPLCHKWREQVIAFIQHLKENNAPENVILRNERSLVEDRSAGATFVGIRFNGNNWNGSVLGDSCLIEWDGENAQFYTSQDVDAFDSYPDYFDSNATKEGKGIPKPIQGVLDNGCVLLVSDPFSDFLLEHKKQGDIEQYINQILKLSSHADFENLVGEWRNSGMHNDDTTLVIVENDDKEEFNILHHDDIEELKEQESPHICEPDEIEAMRENSTGNKPIIYKETYSPSDDEKDFIEDLRDWLKRSLRWVKINNGRINKIIKRLFDKTICKNILQRYKITKR